jgi:hypothetical protein
MEVGTTGWIGLPVQLLAPLEQKVEPDCAITQHLKMEEQIVLDWVKISKTVMQDTVLLVSNKLNLIIFSQTFRRE